MVQISENLSDEAIDESEDKTGDAIIQDTEKSLFELAERGTFNQSFMKFNQALDQTIEMATNAMKSDQGIVGVPTGLEDLDERLGGLHKSDLVIIAGRPSMGKTALATNIAYYAAKKILDDNKEIINITHEDIELDKLELQEESNLDSHSQKN